VIVVDSSEVVAILFGEPTADALLERLLADPQRVMSVASYVETGTELAGRLRSNRLRAIEDLDHFLDTTGIVPRPVDEAQARRALRARIQLWTGHGDWRRAELRRYVFLCVGADASGAVVVHWG
jgi:ribonuclease VapC